MKIVFLIGLSLTSTTAQTCDAAIKMHQDLSCCGTPDRTPFCVPNTYNLSDHIDLLSDQISSVVPGAAEIETLVTHSMNDIFAKLEHLGHNLTSSIEYTIDMRNETIDIYAHKDFLLSYKTFGAAYMQCGDKRCGIMEDIAYYIKVMTGAKVVIHRATRTGIDPVPGMIIGPLNSAVIGSNYNRIQIAPSNKQSHRLIVKKSMRREIVSAIYPHLSATLLDVMLEQEADGSYKNPELFFKNLLVDSEYDVIVRLLRAGYKFVTCWCEHVKQLLNYVPTVALENLLSNAVMFSAPGTIYKKGAYPYGSSAQWFEALSDTAVPSGHFTFEYDQNSLEVFPLADFPDVELLPISLFQYDAWSASASTESANMQILLNTLVDDRLFDFIFLKWQRIAQIQSSNSFQFNEMKDFAPTSALFSDFDVEREFQVSTYDSGGELAACGYTPFNFPNGYRLNVPDTCPIQSSSSCPSPPASVPSIVPSTPAYASFANQLTVSGACA